MEDTAALNPRGTHLRRTTPSGVVFLWYLTQFQYGLIIILKFDQTIVAEFRFYKG